MTDMSKPLFKASDGDPIDILRVSEDVTKGELGQGVGNAGAHRLKVRPEALPTGSPMSV